MGTNVVVKVYLQERQIRWQIEVGAVRRGLPSTGPQRNLEVSMLTKTKPEKKGSVEEWRRRLGMPTALLEKVEKNWDSETQVCSKKSGEACGTYLLRHSI